MPFFSRGSEAPGDLLAMGRKKKEGLERQGPGRLPVNHMDSTLTAFLGCLPKVMMGSR